MPSIKRLQSIWPAAESSTRLAMKALAGTNIATTISMEHHDGIWRAEGEVQKIESMLEVSKTL